MNGVQLKQCRNCKVVKSLEQFHKQESCNNGHRPQCKECDHEAQRQRKARERSNKTSITDLLNNWGRPCRN